MRGAVKLWTFTEDPLAVKHYGPLMTKDGTRQFEVMHAREAKGHLVATLKGIATREEAERLNEIAPARGATMLLPFTNAVVPTVDLANKRVVIELPQEIEGDNPAEAGTLSTGRPRESGAR